MFNVIKIILVVVSLCVLGLGGYVLTNGLKASLGFYILTGLSMLTLLGALYIKQTQTTS